MRRLKPGQPQPEHGSHTYSVLGDNMHIVMNIYVFIHLCLYSVFSLNYHTEHTQKLKVRHSIRKTWLVSLVPGTYDIV